MLGRTRVLMVRWCVLTSHDDLAELENMKLTTSRYRDFTNHESKIRVCKYFHFS